uniref:Putative secreted protein n=1 Tax=Anopheles marajoara TaxID=58244 RepID=A0A2M4CF21_9DIPT
MATLSHHWLHPMMMLSWTSSDCFGTRRTVMVGTIRYGSSVDTVVVGGGRLAISIIVCLQRQIRRHSGF